MENKYIGNILDDRYEILELIGEGGMAQVFKAVDLRLNRNVAVKIMRDDLTDDEEFRNRFYAEAHAVAMLSNPNIVAVYDVSQNPDIEYIVMELVDGIFLHCIEDGVQYRVVGERVGIFLPFPQLCRRGFCNG